MLNIEVAVIVTETGAESANTAIQINENIEWAEDASSIRAVADVAVARAEAALAAKAT